MGLQHGAFVNQSMWIQRAKHQSRQEQFSCLQCGQQSYLDDQFALFWLCPSGLGVPRTDLLTHPLASSVPLSSAVRWACFLRLWLVSASGAWTRPTSLRTPSSVWIEQGAGLHGWLNTEEHSGPPVSQRERLTHNEGSSICMRFIVIPIVSSSMGVLECQV